MPLSPDSEGSPGSEIPVLPLFVWPLHFQFLHLKKKGGDISSYKVCQGLNDGVVSDT